MTVRRVDAVVQRTQVRCRSNEVNVVVAIVVFLELNRVQAETSQGGWGWELLDKIGPVATIAASAVVLHGFVLVDLHLDATPGGELRDKDAVSDLLEDRRVCLSAKTVVERVQVSSRDDVREMSGLEGGIISAYMRTNNAVLTSLESKDNGSGALLGPLQNG